MARFFNRLTSLFQRHRKSRPVSSDAHRARRFRPHLEGLEGRLVPADMVFSGSFNMNYAYPDSDHVGADLLSIMGHDNGWGLTLHDVSYSYHDENDYYYGVSVLKTDIHAASFDFSFTGPDADLLNSVVSSQFIGGGLADGAFFEAANVHIFSDFGNEQYGQWSLRLVPMDYAGVSFEASNSYTNQFQPTDWYPDPTRFPSTLGAPYITLRDYRPGNGGELSSVYRLVYLSPPPPPPLPPSLSINDVSVTEGNDGTTTATFTITRSGDTFPTVTVAYATADGSATTASDYIASGGTLTFGSGISSVTVSVAVNGDTEPEPNEIFDVNLSNVSAGASISDGQGVGTIANDDIPPTKFYVVDASSDKTFEYAAGGQAAENYGLRSGNNDPRGAASDASGQRVWVIDNNDYVYVYDAAGNALGAWKANGLSTPEGIASDGTDLWIVDRGKDRVFRFAGGASRTSGSASATSSFALNSSNRNAMGIETDGASLWVVNDGSIDKVFKYSLSGQHLGNWTLEGGGSSPTGITLDPSNPSDVWVVDAGRDQVFQYTAAAGRTSGSQSADAVFNLAAGNSNPQGIADPPPAVAQDLAAARRATAKYHDIDVALADGFVNTGLPFIEGQGFHYINRSRIGTLDVELPQILVYAPGDRLVALEWVIPSRLTGGVAPTLFGETFHGPNAGGSFFLHAWVWQGNPNGMFADTNPNIHSASGQPGAGSLAGHTSGNAIGLDDNAAGWDWFADPTLGHDHEEDGVMADTLGLGARHMPDTTSWSVDAAIVEWARGNKK